jgi:hypothetical protein
MVRFWIRVSCTSPSLPQAFLAIWAVADVAVMVSELLMRLTIILPSKLPLALSF